ncbi:hypothetical protein D3C80_2014200 [compost metagenome]
MLSLWTEHWLLIFGPLLLLVVLFGKKGVYGLLLSLVRPRTKASHPTVVKALEVQP